MMQLERFAALTLALGLALPAPAAAQTAVELSPDTTIAIGGEVLGPEEVGEDDRAGTVVFTGVGVALPVGTNVTAFGRTASGDELFSTDVTVALGGAVVARPGDVVRVTGGVPSIEFDAAAKGLPAGVQVDAVAEAADGSLLVSFDVTVAVDGTTFADEDVARLDAGTGLASLEFDGSAEGIADGLDLDATDQLASGNLLLSFDTSGVVDGVNFDDEDLLEFDPGTSTFTLFYDGSAEHAAWAASDLDAAHTSEADADGDGVPDASDNCPSFPNPNQDDSGGLGFDSDPDGIGDACQCGDVNGNGEVTTADAVIIRRSLLVPPTATMARPDLCDVGGSSACSIADPLIVRRALLVPPAAGITQQCAPALP